jgi:hypothetical protein
MASEFERFRAAWKQRPGVGDPMVGNDPAWRGPSLERAGGEQTRVPDTSPMMCRTASRRLGRDRGDRAMMASRSRLTPAIRGGNGIAAADHADPQYRLAGLGS